MKPREVPRTKQLWSWFVEMYSTVGSNAGAGSAPPPFIEPAIVHSSLFFKKKNRKMNEEGKKSKKKKGVEQIS